MNVVVMDYVEAARLRGERLGWIMFREIVPNIMPPLIAEFGLRFCFVFLTITRAVVPGRRHSAAHRRLGLDGAREQDADHLSADLTPLLPAGAIALLTVARQFRSRLVPAQDEWAAR